MSKIIEKAFDATKKIIRSVFLGSPNLVTSADLNRQVEAIKYQLDLLDEKTGMRIEGANMGALLSGGKLTVNFEHDYIEYKGCRFNPKVRPMTINLTASFPTAYLLLTAQQETLTYETDVSHDIAGAKFADGSSMAAANQVIYKNEAMVLAHFLPYNNSIGIIARFRLADGKLYIDENYTSVTSPLCFNKQGNVGAGFNPNGGGVYPVVNGDTYDEAFSKIVNFLGSGVAHHGTWGASHADEVDFTSDTELPYPCYLTDFGPFVFVNLQGLAYKGMAELLFGNLKKDAILAMVFHNLPDNVKAGSFLGAMVGMNNMQFYYNNRGVGSIEYHNLSTLNINCSSIRDNDYYPISTARLFASSPDINSGSVTQYSGVHSGVLSVTLLFYKNSFEDTIA